MHNFGLPHLSVWEPLYDVYVIMGTLMYARIHMGVLLTHYDVCIHKGPFVALTNRRVVLDEVINR